MTGRLVHTPAFGHADLSNCEREQIHLTGSIQPHGCLLLLDESSGTIIQASANAPEILNTGKDVVGLRFAAFGGTLPLQIAPILATPPHSSTLPLRGTLGGNSAEFVALLHAPPEGGLIVELERAAPPLPLIEPVEKALRTIVDAPTLRSLFEESASIFKQLTGYDRVMVYRFDEDGHGEIYAERREPHLEAFLGNHYPASDIPQMARRLYERNRVRVLVDVGYSPVPLTPRLCPLTGQDLDMSLCFLRSMSPIHIQYLQNMGVAATLVVSLVVGGKLWGLIACHHYQPRNIPFELRAACELLGETVATRIAALESFAQAQAELSVRRLEQRMIEAISQDGDWRVALFDNSQSLLQPLGASGAALLFEGQIQTTGEVPGTQQLRDLAEWLDQQPRQPVHATASLAFDASQFAPLRSVASGLAATPVSNTPGEYLIWFRPERISMVTWGGDPLEPVLIGDDPATLSPRRSFAKWHQLVEGKCEPWTRADLTAARMIGETVADVVLQFRAVRLLIARDQLDTITRQVGLLDLPVVIADPRGRIVLRNQAFESLLRINHPHLEWIEELGAVFIDSDEARHRLRELIEAKRSWRGEAALRVGGEARSVLVRGDVVFASPDRVLGIVLLFTDISDRKAAETAGRQFQQGIGDRHKLTGTPSATATDVTYHKLLSSVVENAQLAALEITDGMDRAQMLQMLENVRASVGRSAEILGQLIRHSRPSDR